ncbi:MAG TPA: translation initiation factor IF-2 [Lachnospiraceae bacterium]|nr:translation initiation factor IF-2 [Lachnospiraceae bacterium]
MKIHEFAKELTKETGKQVTANQIIMLLSKKREGLRMTSDIDETLMEYAKVRITGKAVAPKKPAASATAQKPKAAATRKPAKTSEAKPKVKKEDAPAEEKPKKRPAPMKRPSSGRLTASTRPDAVIVPKPEPPKPKAAPAKVEEVKEEVKEASEVKEAETVEVKEASEVKAVEEVKEVKTVEEVKEETAEIKEAVKEPEKEEIKEEAKDSSEAKKSDEEVKTEPVQKEEKKPVSEDKSSAASVKEDRKQNNRKDTKDKSDRPGKPEKDYKGDKKNKADKMDSSDSSQPESRKNSRKGDKSKDKEKEARRENRESRVRGREDKRNKKNDFRDNDEIRERKKKQVKKQEKKEEETIKTITLPETLTLSEFAAKIKQPVNVLIKKLFLEGKMYTVNTDLTYEEAELIALEYNIICEQEVKVDIVEEALKDIEDPEDSLVTRPPVVCVMGHVDHGKTSLLDAIRKTSVTEGEAGGITQHIGAYTVKVNDKKITFLDTPGHEAFTSMRLRGALATDIAILVVAADDGVMPQTVEAINHAKAAGVQIIVAVNKIDKPSANVERVKQELVEYGLVAEDWGGDTIFCPVSAKSHEGIDNLLEMILLTSDILELKANPARKARGIVIEAKLDKGRGSVATLLVQKGTLKVGDFIAIGESHGRVRAMTDDKQKTLKEATPSMPVEVIGLSTVPNSGEIFIATDTEKEARAISDAFVTRGKENLIAETKAKMSLDDIFSQMKEGTLKELNIIIKADVQGSVEALKQSLLKLSNEEIIIKCIHSGVGAINESDVSLAAASNAIIIGFNVRTEPIAKTNADEEKVDIRLYRVIYNAIDDIEAAMKGMLDPIYEEKVVGHVEIRQTFKASGIGMIAGSYVLDGAVERNASARITRGKDLIWDGKIASLKRFNDDAKEVKAGYECGIVFEDFSDIREGDMVEVYKMVEVPRD